MVVRNSSILLMANDKPPDHAQKSSNNARRTPDVQPKLTLQTTGNCIWLSTDNNSLFAAVTARLALVSSPLADDISITCDGNGLWCFCVLPKNVKKLDQNGGAVVMLCHLRIASCSSNVSCSCQTNTTHGNRVTSFFGALKFWGQRGLVCALTWGRDSNQPAQGNKEAATNNILTTAEEETRKRRGRDDPTERKTQQEKQTRRCAVVAVLVKCAF